jgi:hypothetical protein
MASVPSAFSRAMRLRATPPIVVKEAPEQDPPYRPAPPCSERAAFALGSKAHVQACRPHFRRAMRLRASPLTKVKSACDEELPIGLHRRVS